MQTTYEAVVMLTDRVCTEHLDAEYRNLAREMTAALCRKRPSPLRSGQPRSWACGIVYLLGQLNFLTDRSFPPYMATADLCAAFGVGQSTAYAKARVISDLLDTNRLDPTWMLPSLSERHPFAMLAEIGGFLIALEDMPGEWPGDAVEQPQLAFAPTENRKQPTTSPAQDQSGAGSLASPGCGAGIGTSA